MASKKKGKFFKILLFAVFIVSITGVATYFLLPKIIVRTMMSETMHETLPPEIRKVLTISKKGVSKVLKKMDIQPQQAIDEINKIDQKTVERVRNKLSQADVKDSGKAAEIIIEEFGFSHINKNRARTFFRRNVTKKDIELTLKVLADNEQKIKFLLPVIKSSLKEIVLTSSSN